MRARLCVFAFVLHGGILPSSQDRSPVGRACPAAIEGQDPGEEDEVGHVQAVSTPDSLDSCFALS